MNLIIAVLVSIFLFQENNPPVVKISAPVSGSLNSIIRYSINVSDKEDGDTRYDEIDPNQILLMVSSGKDTSKNDKVILHSMMASNCMNCHLFNSKLIGPSFSDISKRYASSANIGDIVKRVRDGSKGIWGDNVMPTHSELSAGLTEKMVKWILSFNKKNVEYYLGKEGSIRLQKPVVLTVSYVDHNNAMGEDQVSIQVKK